MALDIHPAIEPVVQAHGARDAVARLPIYREQIRATQGRHAFDLAARAFTTSALRSRFVREPKAPLVERRPSPAFSLWRILRRAGR